MNIFDELKAMGFETVPQDFYAKIDEWRAWYNGDVKKFHNYSVFTGRSRVKCRRYTMGMAKKIAEDWANLLLNEKVTITLEGEKEQQFFDDVCRKNNFEVKANEMQEAKSALGTVAYVPRVTGVIVDSESGRVTGRAESIALDYVLADNIFPLSWENGKVKECAFATKKAYAGQDYIYLQIHSLDEAGEYKIENHLYKSKNGNMQPANIEDIPELGNVPAVVMTGSKQRQFVIDRPNIANNVDPYLPMGIPVYANAIDCLKGVDIAYDSYINEFVLGKKRIIVKPQATETIDGDPLFDPNDTVFYVLPEDTGNGNIVDDIDMTLRTQEHNAGLQDMLNVLSAKCGFGSNHYRYKDGAIATATQVISENSEMFRTIKKHEIILEDALKELCRIILRLGNTYMSAGLNEDVEISIDFDDSIIEDKETDFNRDARMLSMGIMQDWEFRAKWMNEDEKTAKAALPKMQDMTDEPEDEVE